MTVISNTTLREKPSKIRTHCLHWNFASANVHVFLFVAHLVFLIFNEVLYFERGRQKKQDDSGGMTWMQHWCPHARAHALTHTNAGAEWCTCVTSNSNFVHNLNWKLLSKSIWQLLIGWEQRGCRSQFTGWKVRRVWPCTCNCAECLNHYKRNGRNDACIYVFIHIETLK